MSPCPSMNAWLYFWSSVLIVRMRYGKRLTMARFITSPWSVSWLPAKMASTWFHQTSLDTLPVLYLDCIKKIINFQRCSWFAFSGAEDIPVLVAYFKKASPGEPFTFVWYKFWIELCLSLDLFRLSVDIYLEGRITVVTPEVPQRGSKIRPHSQHKH